MRTMTWDEIDKDWSSLQKRHRFEIAEAVARYCVGHSINEVAARLGYHRKWVTDQLDAAGMSAALGGAKKSPPLVGDSDGKRPHQIGKVLKKFAPSEKEMQGAEFRSYQDHYEQEGHLPDAAKRIAKAEWATEAAAEAGVIQETTDRQNRKVQKILFPTDEDDRFELDLRQHMARVEAAARFLDEAKVHHLRRKSAGEKVLSANAKWLEQVERVRNFHPTFCEET